MFKVMDSVPVPRITYERNSIEGGFGLTAAVFLERSLPTALFGNWTRPVRLPHEDMKEVQDWSHAIPAWTSGCTWLFLSCRKIKIMKWNGRTEMSTFSYRPVSTSCCAQWTELCFEPTEHRTPAGQRKVKPVFTQIATYKCFVPLCLTPKTTWMTRLGP